MKFVVDCGILDAVVSVSRRTGLVSRVELCPVGAADRSGCSEVPRHLAGFAAEIADFVSSGGNERPSIEAVDLYLLSPFALKALRHIRDGIPPGAVATYGEVARAIGRPGAARAVGRVMARNPFPLVFPCHRVVRANGGVGGFQGGESQEAVSLKTLLLANEGVVLDIPGM